MSYAQPVRRRRRNARVMHIVRRRRHHNPMALAGRELVPTALWAIAGGVATRAIPQLLLKDSNTGIFGYGANAITAFVLSWAGERFVSRNAGVGLLVGGAVMLGGRMISDFFGKTLVSFGDVFGTTGTSGMGAHGDPSFDLGVYTPGEFVVPTWSQGVMQKQDYPFWNATPTLPEPVQSAHPGQAAAAAPMHGMGMMTTGRFQSRFAA